MKWIFLIIWFAVASADFAVWRRLAFLGCGRRLRGVFAFCAALADLLPAAAAFVLWLWPDNPLPLVRFAMWVDTLFIITLFARAGLYPFLLFARRRAMLAMGCLCAVAAMTPPLDGIVRGRRLIEVRTVHIRSERLPEAFDGLRIVQFSDLHIGTLLDAECEIGAVVDTVNALKPDMVIFSGDLVTLRCDELNDRASGLLASIEAPLGVWASVGNHDAGIYVKDSMSFAPDENRRLLLERERAMGWHVLDDTAVMVKREDDSVSLAGVSFPDGFYDFRHDSELPSTDLSAVFGDVPPSVFNIAVCHLPQLWDDVLNAGYGDLTLAGHFHGMQAGMRIAGCRLSPARLLYRHWSGLYERDGRWLYINDGIGYVGMFMRIGTRPEITLFILEK